MRNTRNKRATRNVIESNQSQLVYERTTTKEQPSQTKPSK